MGAQVRLWIISTYLFLNQFHPACAGIESPLLQIRWYCRGCQVEPLSPKKTPSISSLERAALSPEPESSTSQKTVTRIPHGREISRMSAHSRESTSKLVFSPALPDPHHFLFSWNCSTYQTKTCGRGDQRVAGFSTRL